MTTANTKYSASLEKVRAALQDLKAAGIDRNTILVEFDKLLHDGVLFTKGQRANVVKAMNAEFELGTTLAEVKAAKNTPHEGIEPKAALHVDGLSGTAKVDNGTVAKTPVLTPPPQVLETDKLDPAQVIDGKVIHAGVNTLNGNQLYYTCTLEGNFLSRTEVNPEPVEPSSEHVHAKVHPTNAKTGAPDNNASTTEENTMKMPHDIVTESRERHAAAEAAAGNTDTAAPAPAKPKAPVTNTQDITNDIISTFLATNQQHLPAWNKRREEAPGYEVAELFKGWLIADPVLAVEFSTFLQSYTPAEPKTWTGNVMTTLRGNREEGLSSGVVAAAAAVIGGGLEMAFKGSATLGSGLGTVVGAGAAYFAAEATDSMMDSETGRYIVAGSIGAIAGGLGSRVGRVAQERFIGANAEVAALPEAPAPVVPAPALSSMMGNSAALAAALSAALSA